MQGCCLHFSTCAVIFKANANRFPHYSLGLLMRFRCATVFLIFFFPLTLYPQQKEISLADKIKRFAPTTVSADISRLSAGDRKALKKLIEAAKLMDRIYIRQVWRGNEALKKKLESDRTPLGKLRLRYFNINMAPWSKLDHDKPFVSGVPSPRPLGANFYPEDMGRTEFGDWFIKLPDSTQQIANGFYSVIRRDKNKKLKVVRYSEEYKDLLRPAAKLLREAADLTTNSSLQKFLRLRADAFLTDNYYESDVAWMELDSPLDITIGPYEVYLDELFNYKAAFEAYISIRDDDETKKLEVFSSHLQELEDNLPIDSQYRNPKIGALAPLRVVDEIFVGGEARAGVQTAAYNLPNDERITKAMGSKRVMLKNVQEAKFNSILKRIAGKVVSKDQQHLVAFEPFFTHILMHEVTHGLGPNVITVGGEKTTVREKLQELNSAFEEAKADITGLYALQFLMDRGVVDSSMRQSLYATYLAGVFRSVRFGTQEAHGKGMAVQFNYLLEKGAFSFDQGTRTYGVNFAKIQDAVKMLTTEILTIQAQGDYKKAASMLDTYGRIGPDLQDILDGLGDIPVDIEPLFTIERQLRGG